MGGLLKRIAGGRDSARAVSAHARAITASSPWAAWLSGDADTPFERDGQGRRRADGLDALWTYVAVARIAEAVAQTPWKVIDAGDDVVERGALIDLLTRPNSGQGARDFIEQSVMALYTAGATAIVKEVDSGAPAGPASLPSALYLADAARFRAVTSRAKVRDALIGWVYTSDRGEQIPFLPEEVIPIRLPAPSEWDPLKGFAPQRAAHAAVNLDRSMSKFGLMYFDNDAAPGMVLTTDATMQPEQLLKMREDWDKRHKGVSRAHKVAILHKGLKPVQIPTMRDIAFNDLSKQTREHQLAAHGVTPIVAGIVDDANRSNSDSQILLFVTGVVMSCADRIGEALNRGLVSAHAWPDRAGSGSSRSRHSWSRSRHAALRASRVECAGEQTRRRRLGAALARIGAPAAERALVSAPDADLFFAFDFDQNATISAHKLDQATKLKAWFEMGVPLNHLLDFADIPLPREPGGDVAFLPFSVAPREALAGQTVDIGGEEEEEEPAAPPPPPDDEDDEDAEDPNTPPRARRARRARLKGAAPADPGSSGKEAATTGRGRSAADGLERKALIRAAMRGIAERHRGTVAPIAGTLERAFRAHLRAQRDEVLANVRREVEDLGDEPIRARSPQRHRGAEGETRAEEVSQERLLRIVFDLRKAQSRVVEAARPALDKAARLGAAQGLDEGGVKDAVARASVLVEDPRIQTALEQSRASFRLVERSRHGDFQRVVRDSFEQGRSFNDLVQSMKEFYEGRFANAKRAALTETTKVLNSSRHEGMKAAGVTGKLWLTTSGERTRDTHAAAEEAYSEKPIPIDEPFIVGGHALRFPADPDGPAEEIINCHCVQLAAFLGEEGAEDAGRTLARYADRPFISVERVTTLSATPESGVLDSAS